MGGGGGECSRTSLVSAVNKENLTNDGKISGFNRKWLEYSLPLLLIVTDRDRSVQPLGITAFTAGGACCC